MTTPVVYLSTEEAERLYFWGWTCDEGYLHNAACPTCGLPMVEEPTVGGAMFICYLAVPSHRFYVWMD